MNITYIDKVFDEKSTNAIWEVSSDKTCVIVYCDIEKKVDDIIYITICVMTWDAMFDFLNEL